MYKKIINIIKKNSDDNKMFPLMKSIFLRYFLNQVASFHFPLNCVEFYSKELFHKKISEGAD